MWNWNDPPDFPADGGDYTGKGPFTLKGPFGVSLRVAGNNYWVLSVAAGSRSLLCETLCPCPGHTYRDALNLAEDKIRDACLPFCEE